MTERQEQETNLTINIRKSLKQKQQYRITPWIDFDNMNLFLPSSVHVFTDSFQLNILTLE